MSRRPQLREPVQTGRMGDREAEKQERTWLGMDPFHHGRGLKEFNYFLPVPLQSSGSGSEGLETSQDLS